MKKYNLKPCLLYTSPWQKEFEEAFDYEETDDQLRAIAEIKADMERSTPMDRLLCGDVGYGKTCLLYTSARDIAAVLRDLRLHEHDIEHDSVSSCLLYTSRCV